MVACYRATSILGLHCNQGADFGLRTTQILKTGFFHVDPHPGNLAIDVDESVMKSLVSLEALQPTGDMSHVRKLVQFFLDNLLNQSPDQETTFAAYFL
ncbi:protein kinase superfamily protein [Artemisia annua]|uniref:Protein kinase superfamily protein n=1 Tax=Artemisia annua TaxID=35608 RepID=A0A2U1PHB1_ARTAN|nr:protein kinase superfamily protein [Artemisia annua]